MKRLVLALFIATALSLGLASVASAWCALENPLGGCLIEVP
jgi:hypothetical protein